MLVVVGDATKDKDACCKKSIVNLLQCYTTGVQWLQEICLPLGATFCMAYSLRQQSCIVYLSLRE